MQTIEYVFFTTFCRYHDDDDDHRSHCRRRQFRPQSPASIHKNSARVVIQFNDNQIFYHAIISPTTLFYSIGK